MMIRMLAIELIKQSNRYCTVLLNLKIEKDNAIKQVQLAMSVEEFAALSNQAVGSSRKSNCTSGKCTTSPYDKKGKVSQIRVVKVRRMSQLME